MDLKDIQELIKFVAKSGATEVDLEIDNVKISIKSPAKKKRGEVDEIKTIIQQTPAPVVAAPVVATAPVVVPVANTSSPVAEDESNYITIKASMIGTFYRSASPENPPFSEVGDTIKEGDKQRTQLFKGDVLQTKGTGATETFTVRKISHSVGVERIFPLNSPLIEKIEVNKKGRVRRAKIYYLRELTGKKARIKEVKS